MAFYTPQEEELKRAAVLIYANKQVLNDETNINAKWPFKSIFMFHSQDLPGALDDAAVTEALELHKIKSRQWAIFKTSAIKGEGLFEGLDW